MVVKYTKGFVKDTQRLTAGQKDKLKIRLRLFEQDRFNSNLNNHALKGKYLGYRSINVTGDLRAIFKIVGEEAIFVTINSHSNLYG